MEATLTPDLRDVDMDDFVEGPFAFDRRREDRVDAFGDATAFVVGGNDFGRIIPMHMADASSDSVGVTCDAALMPGTIVTIGFEDSARVARRAVVVRCQPIGAGYRLGLLFERRLAA
ncbi:MAG: PilZ domain-containing protein [Phycisphaerales bacterium]